LPLAGPLLSDAATIVNVMCVLGLEEGKKEERVRRTDTRVWYQEKYSRRTHKTSKTSKYCQRDEDGQRNQKLEEILKYRMFVRYAVGHASRGANARLSRKIIDKTTFAEKGHGLFPPPRSVSCMILQHLQFIISPHPRLRE
jgi:hypothetical protein